jgi:pimeloyl-ACP methyl ester carboxylesterase
LRGILARQSPARNAARPNSPVLGFRQEPRVPHTSPVLAEIELVTGFREGHVEARGLRFHYLEWGDPGAPPLVLLHGLTGHAHTWDHVARQLAGGYHVLVPDQRGHGDTQHAASYATTDFVDDLEALREAWDLDRFVLVGLSMGAHNAMGYAAGHSDRVSHLVVIDIPPKMDRARAPNWEVISRLAETGHVRYGSFDEAFVEARAGNATAPDANLAYRTRLNLVEQPDGTLMLKYDPKAPARWQPADLWPVLPSLAMPALVVRGGLTRVLSQRDAARMVAALPDAELLQIDDSGHSVPTDRPEKLAPLLLDWLQRR